LIFAAVVVAWAVFLVPWALRRYDEATRTRSVDTFSRGMRLLGRGKRRAGAGAGSVGDAAAGDAAGAGAAGAGAAAAGDAAVDPEAGGAGTAAEVDDEAIEVEPIDEQPIAARPALKKSSTTTAPVPPPSRPSRAAARTAARRRRRVLGVLFGLTVVVGGLAAFAVLPLWAVAIPAGLVVGFLALCRWQVRREDDAIWVRRRALESDAADGDSAGAGADDEPTVAFRKASAEARDTGGGRHAMEADAAPVGDADLAESTSVAVTVSTEDGRSLWDPLPVTLPTYVSKAKATRTVRTIDLGEPDAWTSGHVEGEQTELPTPSGDASDASDDADEQQRAVGD
jgi:hypothetical protein